MKNYSVHSAAPRSHARSNAPQAKPKESLMVRSYLKMKRNLFER
jgi:hypothetical protein